MKGLETCSTAQKSDSSRISKVEPSILTLTNLEVFLLGGFMRNNELEDLISKKPNLFMVKSKDLEKGLDIKAVYSKNAQTRYLTIGDKTKLLDAMRRDTTLFLEKIINWHLEEEKILSFIKGGCLLLPTNYRRFYDECVAVETDNYKLYINDKAIERCSDIVFKLSERSSIDCFNFVKGKLEKNQAEHLYISLDTFNDQIGRCASFEGENELNPIMPDNTVCYSIYKKEDGTYDEKDVYNILSLIEEFTKARGLFKDGKHDYKDLVMYNRGSMKIQGIDKDKRIIEKVKTLLKER
jgi:hypothetical protein